MGGRLKFIGEGIYTIPEASRLVGVHNQSIYRWLFGGSLSNYQRANTHSQPVIQHKYDILANVANLSFADLIQIRFIHYFRSCNISLQTIRTAAKNAACLLESPHPFCSARFKTDGQSILAEIEAMDGCCTLLDLKQMQQVFKEVISPFLRELEYKEDFVAKWWHDQGKGKVVIDPQINFGQPTLAEEGVPTQPVFQAFRACGDSFQKAASWFEIPESSVQIAVAFEESLAA